MSRSVTDMIHDLKLRWKLVVVMLPLVLLPIFIVVGVIGTISIRQVDRGIIETGKEELDIILEGTIDLLESYADITGSTSAPSGQEGTFEAIREKIRGKKVGETGYVFSMDCRGKFTIHPNAEGETFWDATDTSGHRFIQEMCSKKTGWISYPWRHQGVGEPRMKIVHYAWFPQWDWIVAVGSYEDEFYEEANRIKWRIFGNMLLLTFATSFISVILLLVAATSLTDPINHMIAVIRRVRTGRLDQRMEVSAKDDLGEMAEAFNRMIDVLHDHKEMEASLAQQGKMASLGVLASGVAHEINNPLGVILGYAGYLEKKIPQDDPNFRYLHEIKRESKRCKKIVQDLLSYARTPKPTLERTDLNDLLDQIVDFAANHTDMRQVTISRQFDPSLPEVMVDGDQMRQVAINLMLNAGGAMPEGGHLEVSTAFSGEGRVTLSFRDTGAGISPANMEKIFEPFFTTKARGTGLGLAITKQIIDQHQGRIRIDSTVGEGTTVTVELPVTPEEF